MEGRPPTPENQFPEWEHSQPPQEGGEHARKVSAPSGAAFLSSYFLRMTIFRREFSSTAFSSLPCRPAATRNGGFARLCLQPWLPLSRFIWELYA